MNLVSTLLSHKSQRKLLLPYGLSFDSTLRYLDLVFVPDKARAAMRDHEVVHYIAVQMRLHFTCE